MSGYKRVTHTRHVWVLKWLGSQWGPCDPAVENPSKESKGLRFKFFILYPCVWYNFFFIFQDSKFYGPKTVLFYKNSWKPTVFIERDQGKGDLETMVMREVNRILKKSKKHFFLLKKKGLSVKMRFSLENNNSHMWEWQYRPNKTLISLLTFQKRLKWLPHTIFLQLWHSYTTLKLNNRTI